MTLREYILFWQETYDRHQSRPTTYAAHNYVFKNHILPGLGDVLLSELTSEMVGEFLEERKHFGNHRPGSSGLGEETMRHIHRLLQQCLDQAIRDGLLTENPAKAFLPQAISSVMIGTMDNYAHRIASQLYKLAVEQNLCNHILAEDTDMDARDYQLLRGRSVREVQSTNGRISFKEALDFQKTV